MLNLERASNPLVQMMDGISTISTAYSAFYSTERSTQSATCSRCGNSPCTCNSDKNTASDTSKSGLDGTKQLTDKEKQEVEQLKKADQSVRAHEAAHIAASQGTASAPHYEYRTGPDGQKYAVAGDVSVSVKKGRTPQETIENARVVKAAALAPTNPSAQDLSVAASATQMEAEARAEIARQSNQPSSQATKTYHAIHQINSAEDALKQISEVV